MELFLFLIEYLLICSKLNFFTLKYYKNYNKKLFKYSHYMKKHTFWTLLMNNLIKNNKNNKNNLIKRIKNKKYNKIYI